MIAFIAFKLSDFSNTNDDYAAKSLFAICNLLMK